MNPLADFQPGVRLRRLFPAARFLGGSDLRVTSLCCDSRRVKPGDLFVAIAGSEQDGHEFVSEAIQRGAAGVLAERLVPAAGLPTCLVPDTRIALGELCHALCGHPSRQLKVIGVTGTNGKTTTARLIAAVLAAGGYRAGSMGTLGLDDSLQTSPAPLTTPGAVTSASWLARMAANDCSHAVMEVSSHALAQHRTAGIRFDAACFTNIRRDHLDFHGSLAAYRAAKRRLLEQVDPHGFAVLNADDPACCALAREMPVPMVTFAIQHPAEVTATLVERCPSEQTFLLHLENQTAAVQTWMVGDHHIQNCLAAAAVGLMYGIDLQTVARGLESVTSVPGRLERIECGQPFGVYVDYAHTSDALSTVLATLRGVTRGRLICVFGAGGDRDREKRPAMGRVVGEFADEVIITSDNPRFEDPRVIAEQCLAGMQDPTRANVVLDRRQAIQIAMGCATEGDTVLIAGKGHESHQQIGRRRLPFCDRQVAREWLYRLAAEKLTAQVQW